MSYESIVNVAISLDIAAVSRAGFGTIMLISDHVWFPERSRSYTKLTDAALDIPTSSDAYKMLVQAFSSDVKPSLVKVGRQDVDTITITPDAITAIGQIRSFTVVGTDDVAITATFTSATGSETAADITADWATDLAAIVGVTVVDGTGTLALSKTGTDDYCINTLNDVTYTTTTTETPADLMAALTAEDDDFYFVITNDHVQANVLLMAADIEARTKIYFVSVQEVDNLTAYSEVSADTMALLFQGNYFRTSAWFHDKADTTFPEANYAATLAPFDPGKKIIANNRVTGSTAAKDPTSGLLLSATHKSNLNARSANYTEVVGGITITRRGTVSGGATFLVSLVRNRDFLVARITENYQNLLINKPVIPYTNSGIATVENVLDSTLSRYVETATQPNILQELNPYVITFPRREDVSFGEVASGVISGSFIAYLSGAVREVIIQGSMTYSADS